MAGTYTNLLFHLVFSTKERLPLITDRMEEELYGYLGGIIRGEGGVLLEIGGTPDHVHLLARFKADASVSEMVRKIKAPSSKWMNERPDAHRNPRAPKGRRKGEGRKPRSRGRASGLAPGAAAVAPSGLGRFSRTPSPGWRPGLHPAAPLGLTAPRPRCV